MVGLVNIIEKPDFDALPGQLGLATNNRRLQYILSFPPFPRLLNLFGQSLSEEEPILHLCKESVQDSLLRVGKKKEKRDSNP